MAGHVKPPPWRRAAERLMAMGLMAVACSAWSMGPAAPFQPPTVSNGASAPGAPASDAAGQGEPIVPGLSGVRLGRHAGALIDGAWVAVGQQARGATLVAVQRTRVSLRHPDGHLELIEMFPPQSGPVGAAMPTYSELAKP